MKRIYIVLMVCLTMIACKQNDVNFTFSPEAPRAGQSVKFNNLSSSGEEWEWNFGDGITTTIKSPSHTYKQPGTYRVVLKVDGKNSWTAVKEVVVYDTVPNATLLCLFLLGLLQLFLLMLSDLIRFSDV